MDDLLNVVWRARKESDIQKILSVWIRDVIPQQSKENEETLAVLIIPWAKEIFRLTKKPFTLLYIKSIVDGLYSPPFHVMEKLGRSIYTMRVVDSEVIDLSHHLHQTWDRMSSEDYWDVDAVYVSESNTQIPGFNEWLGNLCADLCDQGKTIITDFYSARYRNSSSLKSKSTNKASSPKRFRLGNLFSRKKSRDDAALDATSATISTAVDSEENECEHLPYLGGRFGREGYYPLVPTIHCDTAEELGVLVDSRDSNVILKNVHEVSFGDDETETETETETDLETESSDNSNATSSIPEHYFAGVVANNRSPPMRVFTGPKMHGSSDEKLSPDEDSALSYQRMVWKPSLGGTNSGSTNSSASRKKSASLGAARTTCMYVPREDLLTRRVIVPTGVTWSDGVPFIAIRTNKNGLVITLNGKLDENGGGNGGFISSGAHRLLLNCIRLRKRDLTPSISIRHHKMLSTFSVGSHVSDAELDVVKEEKEIVRDLTQIQEGDGFSSFGTYADDERAENQEDDFDDFGYDNDDGPPTPPGMGSSSDFPPQFSGFSRVAHQFADEDSDDILDGLDDFVFDDEDDPFGANGGPGPRGFRPPALFRLPAI